MHDSHDLEQAIRLKMQLTGLNSSQARASLPHVQESYWATLASRLLPPLERESLDNLEIKHLFSGDELDQLAAGLSGTAQGVVLACGRSHSGRTTNLCASLNTYGQKQPIRSITIKHRQSEFPRIQTISQPADMLTAFTNAETGQIILNAATDTSDAGVWLRVTSPEDLQAVETSARDRKTFAGIHCLSFADLLDCLFSASFNIQLLSVVIEQERFFLRDSDRFLRSAIVFTPEVREAAEEYRESRDALNLYRCLEQLEIRTVHSQKRELAEKISS